MIQDNIHWQWCFTGTATAGGRGWVTLTQTVWHWQEQHSAVRMRVGIISYAFYIQPITVAGVARDWAHIAIIRISRPL